MLILSLCVYISPTGPETELWAINMEIYGDLGKATVTF